MRAFAKSSHGRNWELTTKVSFCADRVITIDDSRFGPMEFRPDASVAYVDFSLGHSWPVETTDRTAIHAQVIANSFESFRHKVFNLGHLMRNYNPEANPRDRILGAILAVNFPPTPEGGWKLNFDKAGAPGVRAVACMFKAAEDVSEILRTYARGETPYGGEWTVSMENTHTLKDCGMLVKGKEGCADWVETTPEDLVAQGYTYIPLIEAPVELLRCINSDEDDEADGDTSTRIKRPFRGQKTILMLGGLNGTIHFRGVGLCPIGKEDAAMVSQMIAGGGLIDVGGTLLPDFFAPLRATLQAAQTLIKPRP